MPQTPPIIPGTSQITCKDLANSIGSTRETVTVLLGRLQREGVIRIARRRIVLTDPRRLAQSVERSETAFARFRWNSSSGRSALQFDSARVRLA